MERCRSVQNRSLSLCDIFTCHYRAPCRTIAMKPPHPTSPYSTSRCIKPPEGGIQYIVYPPFGGYEYTFYIKYPPSGGTSILSTLCTSPLGGTSILSTQPYQGGRIVYVMCNPTALVLKRKHVACWPSSGAPLPRPSPTKSQGGAPATLLTAPHVIFVGIPFDVSFLCTVRM